MNNIFKKPYFDTKKEGVFHYTREQLSERPIFPTLVTDSGGYLFLKQTFGVSDGDELLDIIMDGSLFRFYENDGVFSWKAVLERFRKTDFLQEWEAHIWLARMYILLPLAQKYMMTGDRKYSDAWYKIFRHFKDSNPPYRFDRNVHRFKTDMVWSDMQMVWRMINLIFSVFMLSGDDGCFSREQWCELHEFIRLHAELIYEEALYHEKMKDAQNHGLQLGLSMIMTGVLYPEFENSADFVRVGREIIKFNLELSIYADGVNDEGGISYLPFISRLYLDALLLLTKNGHEGVEGLSESLNMQYEFQFQFSDPQGMTPQMGDSYRFDVMSDLAFVKKLYPIEISDTKKSVLFPHSRMAVLRNDRFDLYIDAMDMKKWHQHYGRMTFVLFCDGEFIVCDSGGINYDRHDLREYLNSAQAHNTLSLDSGEHPQERLEVTDYCLEGEVQHITILCETHLYTHTRTFTLYPDRLEIKDTASFGGDVGMTNNLHLPPYVIGYYTDDAKNQPISEENTLFTQRIGASLVRIKTETAFRREFCPYTNPDSFNSSCYALRIPVTSGKTHTTIITKE